MVACAHCFLAFDRSKNTNKRHLWEAKRGVRRGTADTVLLIRDRPAIWCELKARDNTPTDAQEDVGKDIQEAGHIWFWANSVQSYCAGLQRYGVWLRSNAMTWAEHYDRLLQAAEIRREQAKPKAPRVPRKRSARPTEAQIAKVEAARRLPR
jgi:hypothetical protein